MQIIINNQPAALKQGTSFEYVSENRLFSGSDSYSLTITFPLKGCPTNLAIFGHINRADVEARKIIFDCEIRDAGFRKFGSITVNEINETEVKTQFLEGRSEQNFDATFDKVYINELDLGDAPTTNPNDLKPSDAWDPASMGRVAVALPWVNDTSGNIQNCATYVVDDAVQKRGHYEWHSDLKRLSWQPYLLYITQMICKSIGYDCDLSAWEASEEHRYLLICNCLPAAWYDPKFASALPHWTVEEYFEKLELFLGCEFDINHRTKSIGFRFSKDVIAALRDVELTQIVDEHTTEISVEETKCEYREAKNLVYKECDHSMQCFYACDWFMKSTARDVVEYDNVQAMLDANYWLRYCDGGTNRRGTNDEKLLYVKNLDMYFVIRSIWKETLETYKDRPNRCRYHRILQPLNTFGGRIVDDSEDAQEEEIEFVPACVDFTDPTYGNCLFLSFGGYDEGEDGSGERVGGTTIEEHKTQMDASFYNTILVQQIQAGQKDKKSEYYDRIYIGYWDGAHPNWGKLPYPIVNAVNIAEDWSGYFHAHFSMRLNDRLGKGSTGSERIDPKRKTTFSFLSDTIPNPRCTFYIRGKRYLCEKITATFTESGCSKLKKGIFYPVVY